MRFAAPLSTRTSSRSSTERTARPLSHARACGARAIANLRRAPRRASRLQRRPLGGRAAAAARHPHRCRRRLRRPRQASCRFDAVAARFRADFAPLRRRGLRVRGARRARPPGATRCSAAALVSAAPRSRSCSMRRRGVGSAARRGQPAHAAQHLREDLRRTFFTTGAYRERAVLFDPSPGGWVAAEFPQLARRCSRSSRARCRRC